MIAKRVAEVLMRAFVGEVRKLVESEIGRDALHPRSHLKQRKMALDSWVEEDQPLAWGRSVSLLLTALSLTSDETLVDLPQSESLAEIDGVAYARQLCHSVLGTPAQPGQPRVVYPRKLFPRVLLAALAEVRRLDTRHRADVVSFFADVFAEEASLGGLHFVPGPATRATTTVNARAWTSITGVRQKKPVKLKPSEMTEEQKLKRKRQEKTDKRAQVNPGAEWSIQELGYNAFEVILTKTVPPVEWHSYKAANGKFDGDLAQFMRFPPLMWITHAHHHLDMTSNIAKMAMFVAAAYCLQHPYTYTKQNDKLEAGKDFHTKFYNEPWFSMAEKWGAKHQAATSPSIYVLFVASYFLMLYDPTHPMSPEFAKKDKDAAYAHKMPDKFSDKYSMILL